MSDPSEPAGGPSTPEPCARVVNLDGIRLPCGAPTPRRWCPFADHQTEGSCPHAQEPAPELSAADYAHLMAAGWAGPAARLRAMEALASSPVEEPEHAELEGQLRGVAAEADPVPEVVAEQAREAYRLPEGRAHHVVTLEEFAAAMGLGDGVALRAWVDHESETIHVLAAGEVKRGSPYYLVARGGSVPQKRVNLLASVTVDDPRDPAPLVGRPMRLSTQPSVQIVTSVPPQRAVLAGARGHRVWWLSVDGSIDTDAEPCQTELVEFPACPAAVLKEKWGRPDRLVAEMAQVSGLPPESVHLVFWQDPDRPGTAIAVGAIATLADVSLEVHDA